MTLSKCKYTIQSFAQSSKKISASRFYSTRSLILTNSKQTSSQQSSSGPTFRKKNMIEQKSYEGENRKNQSHLVYIPTFSTTDLKNW